MSAFQNNKQISNSRLLGAPATNLVSANTLDQGVNGDSVDRILQMGDGVIGKLLRGPTPDKRFSLALMIPALIALGISSYLAYASLTASEIAGCGSGKMFDCSHVLNTKYSKWMGIPVSLLAAGTYLIMLFALTTITISKTDGIRRRLGWITVAFCGISALMAAVWFVYLQAFELKHFCPWCLGAHTCGLIIGMTMLIKRPFGWVQTAGCTALAGVGIAGLIIGQVNAKEKPKFEIKVHTPAPATHTGGEVDIFEAPMDAKIERTRTRRSGVSIASVVGMLSGSSTCLLTTGFGNQQEEAKQEKAKQEEKKVEPRLVTISGSVKLKVHQWPLIGSQDAEYVFVEMFDYCCPHCRNTHVAVKGAMEQMGDTLAIIVLPVPLNTNCNSALTRTDPAFIESCELSRLAVACWRIDAEQFQVFHEWMFQGAAVPTYANAFAKASELVGQDKLNEELQKEAVGKYIAKHVKLYELAGKGNVPKLMFPTTSIVGEFTSADALVQKIRNEAK